MRTLGIFVALAGLCAASDGRAADGGEVLLKPSSVWAMNYALDSCHLARTFGEGEDKVTVEFRQFGPARTFTLVVVGETLSPRGARREPFTTIFEPLGVRQEHENALRGELADGRHLIQTSAAFDPEDVEIQKAGDKGDWEPSAEDESPVVPDRAREAKVERLRLAGPFRESIVLELGPMDKPMDAMRACIDELLTHWGIDAQAHRTLTRRAVPANYPGDWLTPQDYPSGLLRQGKGAAVHFRLMIDETGGVTDCSVQANIGEGFDKTTCKLLTRPARFKPALDAQGQPIRSFYTSTVTWTLG